MTLTVALSVVPLHFYYYFYYYSYYYFFRLRLVRIIVTWVFQSCQPRIRTSRVTAVTDYTYESVKTFSAPQLAISAELVLLKFRESISGGLNPKCGALLLSGWGQKFGDKRPKVREYPIFVGGQGNLKKFP